MKCGNSKLVLPMAKSISEKNSCLFVVHNPENLRKITTKLCKTNPISQKPKFVQTLFQKELTKIFAPSATQKTKPKQTQFVAKPKMSATYFTQRDYEKNWPSGLKKNKAKSNPIFASPNGVR